MESVFRNIQRPRPNTITFQLQPTSVAYANTLRRLCMSYVETVAFRADMNDKGDTTDVQILANSTPMTNEMLAHRVGLLPLHVEDPLSWTDEMAENFTFTLDKENQTDEVMDVFASDFRVMERRGEETIPIPSNRFFKPHDETHDTCLLAVLKPLMPGGKAEEVRIKAKATMGIGRDNARFIPTSQCAYSYTRDSDPVHQKAVFDDWVIRNKKAKDLVSLETDAPLKEKLVREFNTLEINRCYLKDNSGEPYSFDFTIESAGVLKPEYIVRRACEKGAELCGRYADAALSPDVMVQRVEGRLIGYDFFFQKQDHTLGHLIQAWLDTNMVGNGEITFAGYDIPHPLRDEMVIRIGVSGSDEAATAASARRALTAAMVACQGMFQAWRDMWASAVAPAGVATAAAATAAAAQTAKKPVRRAVLRPGAAATAAV